MKLLSIHVPSNKPRHFARMVESFRATASDPSCFEIVVKIDTDDDAMQHVVSTIREEGVVNLTLVQSPKPKSYFHVWQCMDEILSAADPAYYFCWHVNDEVVLETEGWDKVLMRYVGFFPDHLFRLKISSNMFHNLYRIQDACWAADYPIVPRRWLDVCGTWAQFHGADSYQEAVSFFLGHRFCRYRNVPLPDFRVGGDAPGENMPEAEKDARERSIIRYWDASMIRARQEDYLMRACRLDLAMWAHENRVERYVLEEDSLRRRVNLHDTTAGRQVAARSYALDPLATWAAQLWYVVNREHPQNLTDKPVAYRALVYATFWTAVVVQVTHLTGRGAVAAFWSVALVLALRPKESPVWLFISDLRQGNPLERYLPRLMARAVAMVTRRMPALHRRLQAIYRPGSEHGA